MILAILTKMANLAKTVKMAKIRHSNMNKSNDVAKGKVVILTIMANLTKMANLAKICSCDFLQIRHCVNFWT